MNTIHERYLNQWDFLVNFDKLCKSMRVKTIGINTYLIVNIDYCKYINEIMGLQFKYHQDVKLLKQIGVMSFFKLNDFTTPKDETEMIQKGVHQLVKRHYL